MSWREEFPDYDLDTMPAILAGWKDVSWKNEPCPCFAVEHLLVYVDYEKQEKREFPNEFGRFTIVDEDSESGEPLLDTDDWSAVLQYVESHV